MTQNILIANRGLPALKFILSIKEWLIDADVDADSGNRFPHAVKLFGFVTPIDLGSKYRYIPMLDHAIFCDDDSVYTDIDKIVKYCKEYNIHQVFPGWGYLSENETFVKTLADNQILFIGPTYDNMTMVGNKISCNTVAEQLGVPVLPFSGSVQLDTLDDIERWCDKIGYPVMLKAGNSGGGKGIRIVREKRFCNDMWREIQQEVVNPMIYATKYIENASHLEIQILGDGHSAIHLHGRDCTTQRRNQKLVEECPIQKDPSVVHSIEQYATKIANHIRYRGLATVEFIYDQDTKEVFILEVNPRIQVEHIITERLFGVNLIKLLYLVSNGVRLSDIPEIATLNYNFDKHIVSVRINSENPYEDFRPTLGRIDDIDITYNQSSWGYFSVANGASISETVDSQFGHILSIGGSRRGAIRNMTNIIESLSIRGTVCTTASFLKNFLHRSVFATNHHTTRFLDNRSANGTNFDPHNTSHPTHIVVILGMLQNAVSEFVPLEQEALLRLQDGHDYPIREANKPHQTMIVYQNAMYEYVYTTSVSNTTDKVYTIRYLGQDYVLPFSYEDKQIRIRLAESVDTTQSLYMVATCNINESQFELLINHRRYHFVRQLLDQSTIRCPVGGKVVECLFESGTDVAADSVFVKIECMKMIMSFKTSRDGVIRYRIKPGETVQPRQVICEYDEKGSSDSASEMTTNPDVLRDFVSDVVTQTVPNPIVPTSAVIDSFEVEDYAKAFSDRYEVLFGGDKSCTEAGGGEAGGNSAQPVVGSVAYLVDDRFVLYVNNLKHRNGVFSAAEDEHFFNCLRHARQRKLPFVFVASNSGAEIRIGEEVKFELEPHIVGDEFRYLYLTPDCYEKYRSEVIGQYRQEFDHYEITCVRNPGVVTLDGSALLVSEMARARKEIMTITFVVNRTVGVGAYLARLSERIVQRSDSVLLLTGYQSINKVLGSDLYTTNAQLGGPNVMANNGISHKIVQTTIEGIEYIKRLLDFGSDAKTNDANDADDADQCMTNAVSHSPLVPPLPSYIRDTIDRGTLVETMEQFASNVTTGRCRIGGKRFGIIFPTVGGSNKTIPCDPADLTSSNKTVPLSPNILYPDTSYKIAKTIRDCRVERTELFIVADWRGFSGGTRDMYDKVLDFGSMIVSELAEYDVPVTVYVPPGGQLRGGSMVVFSKSINRDQIKFYVSDSARINVLEANATKELKYKPGDMMKYSKRHHVTDPDMMERIATHFVELNDRVDPSVTVLNRYEFIVDGVVEPNKLREMIAGH